MYNNQGIDEITRCDEDSNTSTPEKSFCTTFSPQLNMKYLAKSRYHQSSQSYPKKSKSVQQFRSSRSLDFGSFRSNQSDTRSPSTTFRLSSRSAKIMRALNFSNCPVSAKKKSISKVLNFDVPSLSPQSVNTPGSVSTSASSLDLHLSISSHGSSYNGLGNSVESTDENQNRTPSSSKNVVKKTLAFNTPLTPQSDEVSRHRSIFSPSSLRPELRKKIDDIIMNTPVVHHAAKKNNATSTSIHENSTMSRNLFLDFQREAEDDPLVPSTPKNVNRPVPESMSAIKMSHKKERQFRRLHESLNSVEKVPKATKLVVETEGNTVKTPTSKSRSFPPYLVDSIKSSHKKEKDKSKVSLRTLISDQEVVSEPDLLPGDKEDEEIVDCELLKKCEEIDSEGEEVNEKEELLIPDCMKTPENSTPIVTRYMTPKNNVNLLEKLVVSSMKKSHKKNKHLVNLRSLNFSVEAVENAEERPTTPDVLNSSKLLIEKFESVKKSHRKEKKNKSLSKFSKLQNKMNSSLLKNDSFIDNDFAPLPDDLGVPLGASALQKKKRSDDEKSTLNDSGDFKIFTPLRKKKIAVPKELCRVEVCVERCDTPTSTASVVTSTPENKSRIELVEEIGRSIKKSHRKNKLAERQSLSYVQQLPESNINMDGSQASVSGEKSTPPQNPTTKSLLRNIYNSSIKKSHKKERQRRTICFPQEEAGKSPLDGGLLHLNSQGQIFSDEEENLSDDGSIFNYSDKLEYMHGME